MNKAVVNVSIITLLLGYFIIFPALAVATPILGVAPLEPQSGDYLSLWYGSNSGSPDLKADIWLATTSASGDSFTFGGESFIRNDNLAVAGYKDPVYGLYLGTVEEPEIGSWLPLTDGEFGTGGKDFYVLKSIIKFTDFLPDDSLYAVTTGSGVTAFAPQTIPNPEPATMLLLGSGLIGFALIGRKKFFKK